ncbi:MAG: class II aldolase/adducin family protein [Phycisphaerae bacterium]|jgi:L-fuculose-phosphate aldolase
MTREQHLKKQICEVGRRMFASGFVAANDGNITCRLGKDRFLCTPTLVSKGYMKPADIAVVDGEGRQIRGARQRTSEIMLHLEIYHERPEVNAVCHAHPPHATAFAAAGVTPPSNILTEVEMSLGAVPLARYETPGTREFARSVVPHLRNKANTILLANHGAVSFAKSLEQAYFHLETLDMYCRIVLLASHIGGAKPIPADKVIELRAIKKRLGL